MEESYEDGDHTLARIRKFFVTSLNELKGLSPKEIVTSRYAKFRGLGKVATYTEEEMRRLLEERSPTNTDTKKPVKKPFAKAPRPSRTLKFVADRTLNDAYRQV